MIGWLKETTGDFSLALWCVAGMLVVSAVLTLSIEISRKRKAMKSSLA